MRLKAAVLEVVRGAAGATLLVAVGCAGSEPIAPEPAPPVASAPPVVASPVVVASPPVAVEAPEGKPTVAPSVVMAPVANPSPLAPPSRNAKNRRMRTDPGSPEPGGEDDIPVMSEGTQNDRRVGRRQNSLVGGIGGIDHAAAACGRG